MIFGVTLDKKTVVNTSLFVKVQLGTTDLKQKKNEIGIRFYTSEIRLRLP